MICRYEILCVDSIGNCITENEKSLCYSLLSNSALLGAAKLKHTNKSIEDSNTGLKIDVLKVNPDEEVKDELRNCFLVKAEAEFNVVEPFRIKLLTHLKEMKFEHIYILEDSASTTIAEAIYPKINKVENALRRYLIKFLVTKLGPNWWSLTADAEMKKKVVLRKNNESNFSDKADSKAYLIDFGELGKIVYAQSSGFISRDDIYSKVMAMADSPEAVAALKIELQSNYNKFFKETFKDRDFQQKWENLEKIRHKIAHNSLFISADQTTAQQLSDDLLRIIKDAEEKIEGVTFSPDEREAIRDQIASKSSLRAISDNEMREKLIESSRWANSPGREGFIGLKSFVYNYLGGLGYDYASSFAAIDRLENDGVIEIYDHQGYGHDYSVRAIRLIPKLKATDLVSLVNAFENL
jgi:hypothetical protein